ncbi:polyprenyl synthetase family protein [Pseudofulvibacter geojedonensis]|uniref:Polyprenyl synthetase family protein n=1 Tax=Pseudofulvibacter geojedonensis TaxID=1123758 RepID=A0ABW3I5H8_9FLAO
MLSVDQFRESFLAYLEKTSIQREPRNLYQPIDYILQLGGKRLRPVLTLLTTELFGASHEKALDAALAVEIFHNFSLVHDDIMDDAPLRRGKQTVHEKWDINTGILSGDAMLILAYQLFENYETETFKQLAQIFSKTALEVCEGQQYDVDFEVRSDVTEVEYLKMIEYKTAVLVGAAMKMGAIVAKASKDQAQLIYDYGRLLGIAFQLQDDYLDAFGDPLTFGKQVGGDIIENKKTYLYIKAIEKANNKDLAKLNEYFSENCSVDNDTKVIEVKQIFVNSGAAKLTQNAIEKFTNNAFKVLELIDVDEDSKKVLADFGESLMFRTV